MPKAFFTTQSTLLDNLCHIDKNKGFATTNFTEDCRTFKNRRMMKKKVNLCLFLGYVKLAYVSYRAFKPIMTDVALLMLVTSRPV